MEQNKTDWPEKRFQIVLKLLNKKQDGAYLDCKQIEEQADELMRYLQQDTQEKVLASACAAIHSAMRKKWELIKYSDNNRLYITGVGDAFTFIHTILDKIEEQTTK